MAAQETLDIIAKPWCNLEDLMKPAQVGRNLDLELRHKKKTMLSIKVINYQVIIYQWIKL